MRIVADLAEARAIVNSWCANPKYAGTDSTKRDQAAQALLDHIGGPGSDLEAADGTDGKIIANSFDLGAALGLAPDLPVV